jgi:thiamine biosynthesis protein ThiS
MILINDRDKIDWFEGITVKDILNRMEYTYIMITVTVNGEVVTDEDYETYTVSDNADVKLIHLCHGG